MFRTCTVAAITAAGLAVAACGTDYGPTAPETGSAPSFRSEHSPPGPGTQVSRGEGGFFATFRDPGAPYFVAIGVTPRAAAEFCSGTPVAEGTGKFIDISSNVFGGPGRGTSGYRINGTVTDLAGERHHVLVVVHSYLGPNGFVDRVRKIKVN